MSKRESLFSGFNPITREQWIEKITGDLKGKPFGKLFWHPEENMELPPFYTAENLKNLPHLHDDFAQKAIKTPRKDWKVSEIFNLKNETVFSQITTALDNDVRVLKIELSSKSLKTIPSLLGFLKDAEVDKISFYGENAVLKKLTEDKAVIDFITANPNINFLLGFNFLSELTANGKQSLETEFILILKTQFKSLTNVRFLLVNGDLFHNAGASVVQELAYSLSVGSAYLPFFETGKDLAGRIEFLFSVGSNYFFEIAKLRTFRILWAKLLQLKDERFSAFNNILISSVTSRFNKTIFDSYVNMLRNTTEAMAAIIGGTDELTVLPFDFLFEKDYDFGKRIARNVQHILRHETHIDAVNNISAGSYYIENLTHTLSENSWTLFKEVETNGGYEKLVKTGWIKQTIEKNAETIIRNFNTRKKVLVGINNYPNISNDSLETIDAGILTQKSENPEGLKIFRLAGHLETIRLNTKTLFTEPPKVFLFTYGNLVARRARAGFSLNFLGAAGFEILDNNGFESLEAGITAFKKSNADILVVCSSDEEYAGIIPALSEVSINKVLLVAGNPENINVSAKVDFFIFSGSDIFDTLQKIQEQLLKIKEIV